MRVRSDTPVYVSAGTHAHALKRASPRGKKKLCYRRVPLHVTVFITPPKRETPSLKDSPHASRRSQLRTPLPRPLPSALRCCAPCPPLPPPLNPPHFVTSTAETFALRPVRSLESVRATRGLHRQPRPVYAAQAAPNPYPLPAYRPAPYRARHGPRRGLCGLATAAATHQKALLTCI